MKLFLALIVAACLGVAIAGPGMSYGNQDTSNQMYRDPSTGRSYSQDQVHQALEAMFGMGAYNNQMYDSQYGQRMNQPYASNRG